MATRSEERFTSSSCNVATKDESETPSHAWQAVKHTTSDSPSQHAAQALTHATAKFACEGALGEYEANVGLKQF